MRNLMPLAGGSWPGHVGVWLGSYRRERRPGGNAMTRVAASITMSLDGYITGRNDGPGRGLGDGGERLHYWVFGGPWSYDQEPKGEATGADKQYLDEAMARSGAVIIGRNMY